MNRSIVRSLSFLVVVTFMWGSSTAWFAPAASLSAVQDDAVKVDRERIAGTWRVVALEINGNIANQADISKLSVTNHADGTWSLSADGKVVARGASEIDPSKSPKTIDFTTTEATESEGKYLGIYELGETTRRLCFAPLGKPRPTEFSSTSTNQHFLVTFERVSR